MLISSPDAAQLAAWQDKYGQLFLLNVDGRTAYLRAPKRQRLIEAATRHKKDVVRLLIYLLHSCWLGGAVELKVKDDGQESPLFRAVIEAMLQHFTIWADTLI
jgi:hypothetical protein